MQNPLCILIFDLDLTIDSHCMKHGSKPRNRVEFLLNCCERYNWPVYVCTARRLSDFKGEGECLSYNIPMDIVEKLCRLNHNVGKKRRWFYYTYNDDQGPNTVQHFFPHVYNSYRQFIQNHQLENDEGSFQLGILKMLHIEEMLDNHRNDHRFDYKNVFFFDDSSLNKLAWQWFVVNNNHFMKDLQFVGGRDKSVFSYLRQDELNHLLNILEGLIYKTKEEQEQTKQKQQELKQIDFPINNWLQNLQTKTISTPRSASSPSNYVW